jgi:hypothetical protein
VMFPHRFLRRRKPAELEALVEAFAPPLVFPAATSGWYFANRRKRRLKSRINTRLQPGVGRHEGASRFSGFSRLYLQECDGSKAVETAAIPGARQHSAEAGC